MAERIAAKLWQGTDRRCGKRMAMGEICWRRPGHKDYCRSQYAVENQNRARRKWPLERVVA